MTTTDTTTHESTDASSADAHPAVRRGASHEGHVDNTVRIDAPLDLVWDMTNDIASWPGLFTEYSAAQVLEPDAEGPGFTFSLSMHPDDNGTVWSWVSHRQPDREALEVRSYRVETGPFEFMDIFWTYTVVGGTDGDQQSVDMRWVQDFRMRPQAPVDTAAMTARMNANTAVQMTVIKSKIEAAARSGASHAPSTEGTS